MRSPKTERHAGRESRVIPLFAELRKLFEARFDEAEPGDHVLPPYCRADKSKVTTMLTSAIKRAGLTKWPRLWHSLRATRQTELSAKFPAHVCSAWLGNSLAIAEKHYMMVTPDHFAEATRNATQPVSDTPSHDATNEGATNGETLDSLPVADGV